MSPDRSPLAAARSDEDLIVSEREARQILDEALSVSAAEHTEVVLHDTNADLTRFANNQIHQNVSARDHVLTIHAIEGRRSGCASTNQLDASGLRQAADRALSLARLTPEDEHLPDLADAETYTSIEGFCAATADSTPEARAAAIGPVMAVAGAAGLDSAGALATHVAAFAVANSRGRFAYHADTRAHFTCTVRSGDSSGWVDVHRRDVGDLDVETAGRVAIDKAERSRAPRTIEPGSYTVVLEPAAAAELVAYLGFLGLGALAVQEGRSFMSGRLGERVTGSNVTLLEDPYDPRAFGRPFDYEGTARQRLIPIERGIAKAALYDRRTARKDGVASTGNASAPPGSEGPLPYTMVLAGGDGTMNEMIASTERGILITRFWYTRVVDPKRTKLTSMTRDGTFWIENGRVTHGLRNLRHNETVLGALERVAMIGRDPQPMHFDFNGSCVVAPALKIEGFTFTGVTTF